MPLYIEFKDLKVLVIGGGGVGTSRAKKFLSAGAEVRVLSLAFSGELEELKRDDRLTLVEGNASETGVLEKHVKWCDLITVAIGNLAINVPIIEVAKVHRKLVNLANDAKNTQVVVPFEGAVRGIRFAVTTEGGSGIVARRARDGIEALLKGDTLLTAQLEAMSHLKRYMKGTNIPVDLRMKLYFAVFGEQRFQKLLKEEKVEEAKAMAEKLVADFSSGKRELKDAKIDF